MTTRLCLPVLCFSLAFAAIAQTPQPPQPAREIPPDQKAYTEAGKLTDPEKKIAAYEKLKTDFPDSVYGSAADNAILSTLLKSLPDKTGRIRKTADGIYKAAVAKDKKASKDSVLVTTSAREFAAVRVADAFLNAGIML